MSSTRGRAMSSRVERGPRRGRSTTRMCTSTTIRLSGDPSSIARMADGALHAVTRSVSRPHITLQGRTYADVQYLDRTVPARPARPLSKSSLLQRSSLRDRARQRRRQRTKTPSGGKHSRRRRPKPRRAVQLQPRRRRTRSGRPISRTGRSAPIRTTPSSWTRRACAMPLRRRENERR